jgi:hypothetical protein
LSRRDTTSQCVGMLIREINSILVPTANLFIVPYSILLGEMAFWLGVHAWYILTIHSTEPMMLKPKLMFDGLESSIYECSLFLLCCIQAHSVNMLQSANFCVYSFRTAVRWPYDF